MMQHIDALWIIEHIARELDTACVVKHQAKKKYNINIDIQPLSVINNKHYLNNYYPRLILSPYFYRITDNLGSVITRVWRESAFFNLAWEEIFYNTMKKMKVPQDDFTKQKVYHHAWGFFYKDYLIKNGVNANNIFVNGNPSFQLYKDPYNKYFINREQLARKYGLNKELKWIFIPENYRWAFYTDDVFNAYAEFQLASYKEMALLREFARKSLRELLVWCRSLAKYQEFEIIFRPKPANDIEQMEKFCLDEVGNIDGNFHFIKNETVREWILSCDCIISCFSTTLIEAVFTDKPIYFVEPFPLPYGLKNDWYNYIPHIYSEGEFITACYNNSLNNTNLKSWAEREMLGNGDPINGLVEIINNLINNHHNITQADRADIKKGILKGLKLIVGGMINKFHNRRNMDYFTKAELERRINRWEQTFNE